MKKQITLCIAILLAVAMLLCACGSKTESSNDLGKYSGCFDCGKHPIQ